MYYVYVKFFQEEVLRGIGDADWPLVRQVVVLLLSLLLLFFFLIIIIMIDIIIIIVIIVSHIIITITGVCKINARSENTRYESQPLAPQRSMLTK